MTVMETPIKQARIEMLGDLLATSVGENDVSLPLFRAHEECSAEP